MEVTMLQYRSIILNDKAIFDYYFNIHQYSNSEFSFANLFIWRDSYEIQFCELNHTIFMKGTHHKMLPFLLPPITTSNISYQIPMRLLVEDFQEKNIPFLMMGITEEIKETIERDCPGWFVMEDDPNNDDYVYNSKDLIQLPGGKYHGKRNHINRFIKEYNYEYVEITSKNADECLDTYDRWYSQKGNVTMDDLDDEKTAVREALLHLEPLQLRGCGVRIQGIIEAFSLGEFLHSDMAVIHIEKANPDIHGLYAFINQYFAKDVWASATYINREEDMGIIGLRIAKKSYYPVKMVKKYKAFLK